MLASIREAERAPSSSASMRSRRLLPGISNVTLRMRYYGLYAWLCRTYALNKPSNDPEDWKRFVRRAEALYALIAYHARNESGVAGILWAGKAYEDTVSETIDFAVAADPGSEPAYLKQAWGAYGAAYGSQLFAIGIFWESPNHAIPVPSKTVGDRLARVFAEELRELAELFGDVIARGVVTGGELDRLSPVAPSEIGLTGDERALYQEILLTPHDSEDRDAVSRRLSLLLVLNVAGLIGRAPDASGVPQAPTGAGSHGRSWQCGRIGKASVGRSGRRGLGPDRPLVGRYGRPPGDLPGRTRRSGSRRGRTRRGARRPSGEHSGRCGVGSCYNFPPHWDGIVSQFAAFKDPPAISAARRRRPITQTCLGIVLGR